MLRKSHRRLPGSQHGCPDGVVVITYICPYSQEHDRRFGRSPNPGLAGYSNYSRHPSLPPAFDNCPIASHQQIAHGVSHPPEPGLTKSPLGLESPARPGFGLHPNPGEKLRPCSCEYGQMSRPNRAPESQILLNCLKAGLNMR